MKKEKWEKEYDKDFKGCHKGLDKLHCTCIGHHEAIKDFFQNLLAEQKKEIEEGITIWAKKMLKNGELKRMSNTPNKDGVFDGWYDEEEVLSSIMEYIEQNQTIT